MNPKRFSLGKLFYNNKFALVFSIFAAVVLWVITVSTDTESYPHAITNVPVNITLSDAAQKNGLKVFSPVNATATVYVKGNSIVVNQLKSSDLQVIAPMASKISEPGAYSFSLVPVKEGNLTDYEVTSISPEQAIISVDKYKEKTFNIESNITYKKGYTADPSYFVSAPALSADTVTISGPEKLVSQVNKVAFSYEVTDTLTESKNFTAKLVMYDANNNEVSGNGLTLDTDKVEVTIPVLPRKVLPLKAVFTNKPSGIQLTSANMQITPQNIEVAGPADVLSGLSGVELAPIDFSAISPSSSTFTADVNLPPTCNNLSMPTVAVKLDLSGYDTRTISVSGFNVKNLSSGKTAAVYTKKLSVTIVGPKDDVAKLTSGNIVGQIDMSDKGSVTGLTEVPVTFSISNTDSCWVYGSYMVNVNIT